MRESRKSSHIPQSTTRDAIFLTLSSPIRSLHLNLEPSLTTPSVRTGESTSTESRFSDPRSHRPCHLQLPYSRRRLRYGGIRGTGEEGHFAAKDQRSHDDDELHEEISIKASDHQSRLPQDDRVGRHPVRSGHIRLLSNRRYLSLNRCCQFSLEFESDDAEGCRRHECGHVHSAGGTVDAGRAADDNETSIA